MAKKIWVVLQQRDGKLHRMSWEAVVAGQKLAELEGGEVTAVILGSGLEASGKELASTALAAVHLMDNEALATYAPGPFIGALAAAIEAEKPDLVVFPHTYQSVDFVPRLAQTVGAALVPEVTGFELGDEGLVFRRPIMAGKLEARVQATGEGTVVGLGTVRGVLARRITVRIVHRRAPGGRSARAVGRSRDSRGGRGGW